MNYTNKCIEMEEEASNNPSSVGFKNVPAWVCALLVRSNKVALTPKIYATFRDDLKEYCKGQEIKETVTATGSLIIEVMPKKKGGLKK